MIRHLQPTDVIQLVCDASTTGRTVSVQTHGPFSIVVLNGRGTVTVQANNDCPYLTSQDYGIRMSKSRLQHPDPTVNTSFSAHWANTSLTANAASGNVFVDGELERRYIRLSGSSISSTTARTVFAHVMCRPRV